MKHRRKGKTLDRSNGPRKALMRGLATSLILHENINTTLAKAKAIRPIVEKLITKGRKGDLHAQRQLSAYLLNDAAVNKVLKEVGPRYKDRAGGYTRIIKLGTRQGDGAEIAQIQLVKD